MTRQPRQGHQVELLSRTSVTTFISLVRSVKSLWRRNRVALSFSSRAGGPRRPQQRNPSTKLSSRAGNSPSSGANRKAGRLRRPTLAQCQLFPVSLEPSPLHPRSWQTTSSTSEAGQPATSLTPPDSTRPPGPCLFLLPAAWRTPRATPHGRSPWTTPHAASWARPHPLPFAGPFAYGGYPAKAAILKGLLMRKHFDTVPFANVIS